MAENKRIIPKQQAEKLELCCFGSCSQRAGTPLNDGNRPEDFAKDAFGGAFFILALFWICFAILLHPFGTPLTARFGCHLASFWFPLAPLGFLFPPFRGSPWNVNAFSYHILRFLLRHVHTHTAVAGLRLCRASDIYIYSFLKISSGSVLPPSTTSFRRYHLGSAALAVRPLQSIVFGNNML